MSRKSEAGATQRTLARLRSATNVGSTLSPSSVRLLTAIGVLQLQRKPATWRNLIRVLGLKSPHGIDLAMKSLLAAGLIETEPDSIGGKRAGAAAIGVKCRFIPADELEKTCN